MEYEKCYVLEDVHLNDRPKKKRRVERCGLHASWTIRRQAYRDAWARQRSRVDRRLYEMNAKTIREVSSFLEEFKNRETSRGIPTGIILSGANATAYSAIVKQLSCNTDSGERSVLLSLSPSSGTNLKAVLKTLIRTATARKDEEDEGDEDTLQVNRKGPRLLNYDLQILSDFVSEKRLSQVVVSFDNTEAFDNRLLSDVVEMLGCWRDRIPFVCLFSVATSVDFLQQRLSRAAVRTLEGRLFDIAPSSEETEQVFDAIVDGDTPMWLGANLANMMLERQRDYIQSTQSLIDAAQYLHLSCYYANALTIFLVPGIQATNIPADHYEALRTLPFIQQHAQDLIDGGKTAEAKLLLTDDETLLDFCVTTLSQSQERMRAMMTCIELIREIQQSIPGMTATSRSSLYVQAMSGRLQDSPLLRNLLLSIRKTSSDVSVDVIKQLVQTDKTLPKKTFNAMVKIQRELEKLVNAQSDQSKPLRSEDDVQRSTLRTTIVAQKVELSKQKSTLSQQDAAYTGLLRRLTDFLETFFAETLVNPKDIALSEIFLYDLRSPYREVFTPRPRHAVERALSSPHDYLDCDCCASTTSSSSGPANQKESTLSSTQPSTAVLYQLYLESGALINASDLWEAFKAVMADEKMGEGAEERLMALYQRGLAEMKYLGMVKPTRKKVDHVAKVAWRGL